MGYRIVPKKNALGNTVTKVELLNLLTLAAKYGPAIVGNLTKELANNKDMSDKIVSTPMFKELKLKSDKDLFNKIYESFNNYIKNIPTLKNKINEEIPDAVSIVSKDINSAIALSLVSVSGFYLYSIPTVVMYLVTKNYPELGQNLFDTKDDIFKKVFSDIPELVKLLKHTDKNRYEDITKLIGTFPNLELDDNVKPSETLVSGFIKSNGVKNVNVISFIKTSISQFFTKDPAEASFGFVGNPIYHIRLLITDIQVARYDRLKDMKRLTELKIIELTHKDTDGSLSEQVEYYKEKLEKLNHKIDAIIGE